LFANASGSVANNTVVLEDVLSYTGDQVLGAVALDAPEIYAIRFSPITHNLNNPWMPTVAFLFRTIVGLILITGLLAIFRGAVLRSYTRPAQSPVSPKPAEEQAPHPVAFAPSTDAH
jgi:hypothetical protein